MLNSPDRIVSRRRVVLGAVAAAAGVAGAGIVSPSAAPAFGGPAHRPVDQDSVDAVASRWDGDLIALRRDLHAHPELAGQEQRTSAVVAQRLRAAGLDVTTGVGGYGVVAVLTGAHRGRTVAYRADMDAVPADEQFGGGTQPAHACGHDIHTTVGVGVAQVLSQLRHRLCGKVVFVFQPAEESLAGAAAMLADGVFSRERPGEIHALHCGPFPVGKLLVMPGVGLPGLDRGMVTLTGPDAMPRAVQLTDRINALGTVAPPATPADLERLAAEIQTPDGPLTRFVFMAAQPMPTETGAAVRVFYRCWPQERYTQIRESVNTLAASAGAAAVSFPDAPFPAMVCPERDALALRRHLRQAIGHQHVGTLYAAVPFNGEDFALFLNRMPGTYTFLGVRAPGMPIEISAPHQAVFDPDERAIGYGVRAMAGWLATRTRH